MWFALFLTFFAGIATVFGGILATSKFVLSRGVLAVALGFSAGAMLYVSFTDILQKSLAAFAEVYDARMSYAMMLLAFFFGITIMLVVDRLIPREINPSETEGREDMNKPSRTTRRMLRNSGMFIAVALCLHNFPEGFLVFMSALDDPNTGIAIAIALAIHNIPEGIAVAAPLYASTKKRAQTIGLTALTGIAEPIGAIIGYLVLRPYLTDNVFGWVFGVVAGMMIFISVDELLPAARRYETNHHQTAYGFIAGMAVISFSIMLFQ